MTDNRAPWRLRGGLLWVRLTPVLLCAAVALWAALMSRIAAYAALSVEAAVLGALLLGWVLRTRVRLTAAGVEVRELWTRVYVWADIAEVVPTYRHRGVRLRFSDGSARTLPVPRRLRSGADREIGAAVALIRLAAHAAEP